jgi:hypothetical protein
LALAIRRRPQRLADRPAVEPIDARLPRLPTPQARKHLVRVRDQLARDRLPPQIERPRAALSWRPTVDTRAPRIDPSSPRSQRLRTPTGPRCPRRLVPPFSPRPWSPTPSPCPQPLMRSMQTRAAARSEQRRCSGKGLVGSASRRRLSPQRRQSTRAITHGAVARLRSAERHFMPTCAIRARARVNNTARISEPASQPRLGRPPLNARRGRAPGPATSRAAGLIASTIAHTGGCPPGASVSTWTRPTAEVNPGRPQPGTWRGSSRRIG